MAALMILSLGYGCLQALVFGCKQLKSYTVLRSFPFRKIEVILGPFEEEIYPVLGQKPEHERGQLCWKRSATAHLALPDDRASDT